MSDLEWRAERLLVIGMVHLAPLPGTPLYRADSLDQTITVAVESACALEAGGADGCLIQTVDRLYGVSDDADPARTCAATLISQAVRGATGPDFAIGIQIMRNAVRASLAVAHLCGGSFVRAAVLVGATVSAHGIVTADPLTVMEYRRKIGAERVQVIADVDSMHFRWLGGGREAGEVAHAARGVGASAVAVGHPAPETTLEMVRSVREHAPGLPVVLAGYTNHDNAARLTAAVDGVFVGGCLEDSDGRVDEQAVSRYIEIVRA